MTRTLRITLAAVAALMTLSVAGRAQAQITGLYSTGVNSSNTTTGVQGGYEELHYTVYQDPHGTPFPEYVEPGHNSAYYTPTGSQWISTQVSTSGSFDPGNYDIRTTFSTGSGSLVGAGFTVSMGGDGAVTSVTLTPATMGAASTTLWSGSAGYATPTTFSALPVLLQNTTYNLDFIVHVANQGNPMAFDATITPGAVPEPSSLLMCGMGGVAGLVWQIRRRRVRHQPAIV